jgi:5-oxoprolinase (ATP-hydrolysing)
VAYKAEFGFLLESQIVIDDIKVKGVGKAWSDIGQSVFEEVKTLRTAPVDGAKSTSSQEVYVAPPGQVRGERVSTPVYELERLDVGDVVEGPALVIDATQTIFINATWAATVTSRHLLITRPGKAEA